MRSLQLRYGTENTQGIFKYFFSLSPWQPSLTYVVWLLCSMYIFLNTFLYNLPLSVSLSHRLHRDAGDVWLYFQGIPSYYYSITHSHKCINRQPLSKKRCPLHSELTVRKFSFFMVFENLFNRKKEKKRRKTFIYNHNRHLVMVGWCISLVDDTDDEGAVARAVPRFKVTGASSPASKRRPSKPSV